MARQIYNDTWASGGDKVDPGAVKTTLGWVVEAPPHEFFNFYQGRTDEMLQDLERNGIVVYNAATIYDQGGYTREGTIVFRSLVGTNTGNTPSSSPSEWVQAFLIFSNNLSDLPDKAAARTNLDVYSKAEADANFLDEASNLSDLDNTGTARTNLDVFSKAESNANFLAIGAKAADSELLDGINSTTFARKDQANTFTADQTIKASGQGTELVIDADTGFDTQIIYRENAVQRAVTRYDESQDAFQILKHDTNGTTVKSELLFRNNGDIDAVVGTLKQGGNPVYHAGNDGAGSGVDADLLDGVQGSGYLLVGAKAADSQLLDGIDSTGFLLVGAKAADSNLLDGIDSTNFLRSDVDDTFNGELLIIHNAASPDFDEGQLELRTTDGTDVSLGFHRSGFTACQLRHESNGLILSGTSRTTAANLEVLGNITHRGDTMTLAPASGNVGLEIGRQGGAATTPFIDFHSGATNVDFDSRIIASGGTGSSGGGTLDLIGNILVNGSAIGGGSFLSGELTIGNGTLVTVTHSLGARPTEFYMILRCKTAEDGYVAGDEISVNGPNVGTAGTNRMISLHTDNTTQVKCRFGNVGAAIAIANKGTGSSQVITNSNWRLLIGARL